uniref:Methyltransferase domain-containing protein n=1 Tax=Heterosigma akashiwo TaxID=2829 RepID=A0A6V1PUG0_HETAK
MEGDSLAPPCQAEPEIIDDILKLADLQPQDVFYDLGCGDGRICIKATQRYGAHSLGIEIEEALVKKFQQNIVSLGIEDKVRAVAGDLLGLPLEGATCVALYLLPEALARLRPTLVGALRRGCRIICNTWGLEGLEPTSVVHSGKFKTVKLFYYDKTAVLGNSDGGSGDGRSDNNGITYQVEENHPTITAAPSIPSSTGCCVVDDNLDKKSKEEEVR